MTHRILTRALPAALLMLLAACGGGGDEAQHDKPTPQIDCQANPKACQ